MDPTLKISKNGEDPQDKDSSPSKALDDKVSSLQNSEDDSRPTSAPPKLYSGSLFLYSNDLYEYFTHEGQDSREDEQYNKFFNYPKPKKNEVPLSKGMSYTNGEGRSTSNKDISQEEKNELNLSRRNSESLDNARLSPDRLELTMGVFNEENHPHEPKQSEGHTMDAPNSHKIGEGKTKSRKKSKSHNSPKKVMENQPYPPAMYPPMMVGQQQYMMRPTQPYMNVNMNMNMMPQDYNYMMNDRMYGRGMMGYQVPVVNYYPYSMYPQNNMPMPPGFGNNYMGPAGMNPVGNPHQNQNQKQKNPQDSHKHNNNNNNPKQSNRKDHTGNQQKSNQKSNKDKDRGKDREREKDKDRDTNNQSQKKDKKRDNTSSNTSSNIPTANLQSLGPDEQTQLIEDALNLAKDQAGCRLLQQKLETNDPDARDRIFEKVIGNFDKLMVDPFGNYFCQKIAETCTDNQTKRIIEAVSPSIIAICLNPHGTRAVQKLIEIVKTESLVKMLARALSVDVVGLVKDNHGNHVVQKCLTNMSEGSRQFIYDSITENCVEIATHKHGCCVMQRCLDFASKTQKNELVRVIANHTLELVEDQYGNYVIQYILDLKDKEPDIHDIVGKSLIGHVVELSKQKFSSNVIEKCLQLNILVFRQHFMDLLSNSETLVELICDQFGNYVIQRCLNNADEELKTHILEAIYHNAQAINDDPFGNKIYTKLAKNYSFLGDNEATSSHTLSPRASEETSHRNTAKKGNKNPSNNNRNNNTNNNMNENKQRGKNNNRNNEKRNSHTGGMPRNNHGGPDQNQSNSSNRYQRGGNQRHSVGSQVMYPHQEMMGQPNMGNPMMQTGFYMAQPQMYGQFYGYPQMPSDPGYNGPR